MDNKYLENLYDRLRDHIKHEDNLINQRLSWFLGFQGLFIVAFGTILAKDEAILAKNKPELLTLVLFLLCFIGYATCISSIVSVNAAISSIIELKRKWIHENPDAKCDNSTYPHLFYEDNSIVSIAGQYSYQFIMMIAWTTLHVIIIFKGSIPSKRYMYIASLMVLMYVSVIVRFFYFYVLKGIQVKQNGE